MALTRFNVLDDGLDPTWQERCYVDGDDLIIQHIEDCEPILERAKMLSEMQPGNEFRHCATIPRHVLDKAFREGWINDPDAWKRWANDPDNRKFRTWAGRV